MEKNYGCELVNGVWWELTDKSYRPIPFDELLPHEWPLHFHNEFIYECAVNPTYDSLGTFCMGWEL